MKKLKQFFSNLLVINLIIIIFLTIIGIWGFNSYLSKHTMNGINISVPDFTGMSPEEVAEVCLKKELNFTIPDTIFEAKMPKGTILAQLPLPNSKVKKDRTIYLTLNASEAPLIALDGFLHDKPLRQALVILRNMGFLIADEYEYVSNPALNWVQGIKFKGVEQKWGAKIPKGSKLTLVLGNGLDDGESNLPNLLNRDYEEVRILLRLNGLTFGGAYFDDESYNDSANAVVYKQIPAYESGKQINPNEPIYVHFTDRSIYEALYGRELEE